MATAADVSDGHEENSGQRRSSFRLLPPNMSELRVVLLGNSWSERSSVGNFILGKTKFSTEGEPDSCVRVRGQIKEKELVLINTPDLLLPNISDDKLSEHVELCVRLSDPGPHVFLLVLQPEDFTEEHRMRLCRVLERFSDQSFDHSMVLVSGPKQGSPVENMNHPSLQEMIRNCRERSFWFEKLEHQELLEELQKVFEDNKRNCVSCDQLKTASGAFIRGYPDTRRKTAPPQTTRAESAEFKPTVGRGRRADGDQSREPIRIFLVGNTGCGKSSTGNTILGRKHFVSRADQKSGTHDCQIATTETDGRHVVVVDSPGLFNSSLSKEEIQDELLKCISWLSPGPHVILLVLQIGQFTKGEKEAVELIKRTFGGNPEDYMMVLFTRGDDLMTAERHIEGCQDFVRDLIYGSGDRYHVFNNKDSGNREQVRELLDKIDNMVRKNGGSCYGTGTEGTGIKEDVKKMLKEMEEMRKEMKEDMKTQLERKHEQEMKEMKDKIGALEMQVEKAKDEKERNQKQQQSRDEMMTQMQNLQQKVEHLEKKQKKESNRQLCGVM